MAHATFFLIILVHFLVKISFPCSASSPKYTSPKFPAVLVFGDSTVDSGNNNYINTLFRSDHHPYGQDFKGHIPTGRCSNGKLVPDFIASKLEIKDTVPPFLHPKLSDKDLLTGVSFASGGSGLDDTTSATFKIIPVSKQVQFFKKYLERLEEIVGEEHAKEIVSGALIMISAGRNDFCFNFYDIPTRRLQFSISEYQDFLLNKLKSFIKDLYTLGCRTFTVAGLPPIGCLPIQITIQGGGQEDRRCINDENSDAKTYNRKLERFLSQIQAKFQGSKVLYADIYTPMIDMINSPNKYGFVETKKGCCGTGLFESGLTCNELTHTCDEASKYLFWDSIHSSEATYKYVAKYLEKQLLPKLYSNYSQPYYHLIK